jgi:hypothetical protein
MRMRTSVRREEAVGDLGYPITILPFHN